MKNLKYYLILIQTVFVLFTSSQGLSRGYDVSTDLKYYDKLHNVDREEMIDHLIQYSKTIRRRELDGTNLECSRQIFLENNWLVNYTSDYAKIVGRFNDLNESLMSDKDQTLASVQSETTGSWGGCYEEWFFKLNETVDYVEDLVDIGKKPKFALRFLDSINSSERLSQYLESVLVSDVKKTGRNNRKELNDSTSALFRFIFKNISYLYPFKPELKDTLMYFLDERWQNKNTGYWGSWYISNGEVIKTDDLSMTFHIISYRKGKVNHWPEIIKTTLAIKKLNYPYGWLQDGKYSNHHNYDVVKIFRYAWKHMTPEQRDVARKDIKKMLRWCIKHSLRDDGSFRQETETDLNGWLFYFGISFLDEVGYFDKNKRFWTDEEFKGAEDNFAKISARMNKFNLKDKMFMTALNKLSTITVQ